MKRRTYHRKTGWQKFVEYIRRTWINKVAVLAILGITYLGTIWTGDATAFVFMLVFFGPAFFMDKRVFY